MTNPQVKPEARVQIYEGMTVENVKRKGSTGQKITASFFDVDKNGVLDKEEAEKMNRCNFKAEKNKLTIYENRDDGTRSQLEIKYNKLEDLYHCSISNDTSVFEWGYKKENGVEIAKKIKRFLFALDEYDKITIDMPAGKVSVQGAEGNRIWGVNTDISVTDSDLEKIGMAADTNLNLKNVKNEGLLFDSATEISVHGDKATMGTVSDSKYITEAHNVGPRAKNYSKYYEE